MKSSKQALRKSSPQSFREAKTGTDKRLLLGLRAELEGYMHIKPPRNCPQYERMTVAQISQRIQDDMEELVARAHPDATEEWGKKFAPNWWLNCGIPNNKRCRIFDETLATKLRPGLWGEINSSDPSKARKAQDELQELLKTETAAEPKHAAEALAFLTKQATTWLENLFVKREALMKEVAKGFSQWPVNLGVRVKVSNKGGRKELKQVITRRDFAESYLKKLGVNQDTRWPESGFSGVDRSYPFHIAARGIYRDLLMMKRNPRGHFEKMTPWAKQLIVLPEPMTKGNAMKWWAVAKTWLDEQWDLNREAFEPLVQQCCSQGKQLTEAALFESEHRPRVIDLGLKKAFLALAKSDDL
ncbi:MAG: hypothetical protein EXS31_09690 [Pedosphaera sp.]|nr:hypothetical protein [Pedosphaera sp.]